MAHAIAWPAVAIVLLKLPACGQGFCCHASGQHSLVAMRTCLRVESGESFFASVTGTTTLALPEYSSDRACHRAFECSLTGADAVAATDHSLSSRLPMLPICCMLLLPVLCCPCCYWHARTQAFDHPNIVKLLDVLKADNDKDIYLVFEHMDTDLHRARKLFVVTRIPQTVKHAHTFQSSSLNFLPSPRVWSPHASSMHTLYTSTRLSAISTQRLVAFCLSPSAYIFLAHTMHVRSNSNGCPTYCWLCSTDISSGRCRCCTMHYHAFQR
jgi:hypothetical protein